MRNSMTVANKEIRILKTLVVIVNMLVLLPPILFHLGLERIATFLYSGLGFLCHQRADRSFFLFGEQLTYEKSTVQGIVPFDQIMTISFGKRFTCNEELGCKFGVCSRCTGMYLGVLVGVFLSELMQRWKIPKIFPLFLLVPLALDGIIQTIAYVLAPERGFYESTNPRRFITGVLFGFGVGYLAVSAIKTVIAKTEES